MAVTPNISVRGWPTEASVWAFWAAIRLARPRSAWAHWRYAAKPQKLARAERRALAFDQHWGSRQRWFVDLIAGAPNERRGHKRRPHL